MSEVSRRRLLMLGAAALAAPAAAVRPDFQATFFAFASPLTIGDFEEENYYLEGMSQKIAEDLYYSSPLCLVLR